MAEPTTSNYPSALDASASLGGDQVNIKSFTLGSNISSGVTSIPASAAISGVTAPFYLLIGSELVYVEGISGSDFTPCVRAAGGTTAAAHLSGATMNVVYAANLFNQLKRAIIAIETELGIEHSNLHIGPDGFGSNYQISTSVSSNNLTIAIKGLDGNDPSATNHLKFRVGNTEYTLTAATSFTKNAGTNWMNAGSAELAAKEVDYFLYAIGETGASAGLKFGFSRIPYATTMNNFVNTTTNEKYIAGNWTNLNATDKVALIGRFNATLGVSASYNWSIPATSVIVNRPIYSTRWLTFSGTLGGFSGTPTQDARYRFDGQSWYLFYIIDGTSNATTFTSTLPFSPTAITFIGGFRATDSGNPISATVPACVLNTNRTVEFYKDWGATGWTNSGGKGAQIQATMPIVF